MSVCSVSGCGEVVHARGLCVRHYHRWRRTSNAQPGELGVPRTARVVGGTAWWVPMPLTVLPTHPRHVGRALFELAERAAREGMTTTQYEREQARILGGQA